MTPRGRVRWWQWESDYCFPLRLLFFVGAIVIAGGIVWAFSHRLWACGALGAASTAWGVFVPGRYSR